MPENAAMESWRTVWRKAAAPLLSAESLLALRDALRSDDPRLAQGYTTQPPPLVAVQDFPVESACAIGLCGWLGDGLETVGEVEEYFARMCYEMDQKLGEPAGCRWLLNWFDETPRAEAFALLLPEVERSLAERVPAEKLAS